MSFAAPTRAALSLALALSTAASPLALAPAAAEPGVMRVDLATQGEGRIVSIPKGKSAIIDLPVDAREVMVTNPGVADALLRTPRRIFIMGQAVGQTDAVFFDVLGRRILSLDVRVANDMGALGTTISRVLPTARVEVEALNDGVVLTGQVADVSESDKAQRLAERFVGDPKLVLNMLSIAGKDQVMLKVRIIEVQRSIIKQLGFNLSAVLNQIGEPQLLLGTAATFGVNGSILGGINAGYSLDTTSQPTSPVLKADGTDSGLVFQNRQSQIATVVNGRAGDAGLNKAQSTIQAFERAGLIRTLAEPNLTAVSGESAKFLVGGEFPVPTGQDTTGRTNIEFKPYGVGLGFTPMVLSGGRIALKISTEVSEPSNIGAFTLSNGTGAPVLTIPGLTVRRAESAVELPSGGALMMAGLLQSKFKQNLDKVPGVADVPILGALARSRDFLSDETELVVIVTPYLVKPTSPSKIQTPADGLRVADDASTLLLGRLNKSSPPGPPPGAAPGQQGAPLNVVD